MTYAERALCLALGRKLAKARAAKGLTQRQVATKVGWTSVQYVSNIERGICVFPKKRTTAYASIVGVTPAMITKTIKAVHVARIG